MNDEDRKYAQFRKRYKGARTFDTVIRLTGPLPPDISEWPPQIFDATMAALEKVRTEKKITGDLDVVNVRVDFDHEEKEWFAHVVAQTKPVILLN
jgi:hypothetical protein